MIFSLNKKFAEKSNCSGAPSTILAKKNKQIVYPTTVILDKELKIELQIQGFIKSADLKPILEKY